ncbi:MAG TPA: hypothetical protein DEO82_03555 [Eubacterium sp.]|nr:hypothetical protein [Eubacterium sp.]
MESAIIQSDSAFNSLKHLLMQARVTPNRSPSFGPEKLSYGFSYKNCNNRSFVFISKIIVLIEIKVNKRYNSEEDFKKGWYII